MSRSDGNDRKGFESIGAYLNQLNMIDNDNKGNFFPFSFHLSLSFFSFIVFFVLNLGPYVR